MKFLIRADASIQIGSGHIMRCLTLAHELSRRGHEVRFVCRGLPGHLGGTVERAGFALTLLPVPPTSNRLPENERSEFPRSKNEPRKLRRNEQSKLLRGKDNYGKFSAGGAVQNAVAGFGEACSPHSPPAHAHWLPVAQAQDAADCAPHIRAFAPDWIVCDHYALSAEWEQAAKAVAGSRLMAVDDLADRPHAADVLLDQNLGCAAADYAGLVPPACRLLLGTRYALLRQEFAQWRETSLQRRTTPQKGYLKTSEASFCGAKTSVVSFCEAKNILVNLGGVDKDNYTLAVLHALSGSLPEGCGVTVVMGRTAPHIAAVQAFAAAAPYPCRVLVGVDNMAELMTQADLAVGAAGSTSWERCCLGLPTVMLVLADNQRGIAERLQQAGAAHLLQPNRLAAGLRRLLGAPAAAWAEQSRRAAALCDGKGAERVANHMLDFPAARVLPAAETDCRRLFRWRNHPDIRRFMFEQSEIEWAAHQSWFARQQANPDFTMLVYWTNGTPQGYAGFKHLGGGIYEWGFYLAPDCPRGSGHGSILGRLALQYAFAQLQAREVRGQVLPHNTASLTLHGKLGFRRLDPAENGQSVGFVLPANEFLY